MLTALVFILLFGTAQAVLLLAVLLLRKKIQLFHFFLSAYVTVMLLQMMFKVISKGWLMHTVKQWYRLSYYLPYLYGPLALLFVTHYLYKQKWQWRQMLHFIPFGISIGLSVIDIQYVMPPFYLAFLALALPKLVLQLSSLFVYHFLVWKSVNSHKPPLPDNEKIGFLRTFTAISLGITSLIAFALFFLYRQFPHHQNIRWAFISLPFFVYWISYKVLQKPAMFKVIQGSGNYSEAGYVIPPLKVHRPTPKYSNSGLKQEEAEKIVLALNKSMQKDKLFLDAALTMDGLAEKLGCQKHHLSQVLNDTLQKSFTTFINEERVSEAKRILASPTFSHYKISSIAYDAGFNSLSSFNEIFKKSEGITPSQFRMQSHHTQQPQIKRV